MFSRVVAPVIFLALGFPLKIIALYVPFLTLWGIFIHANVKVNFGFLRYVVATPDFHRWHHAKDKAAYNKNFAGMFPFIDMIFGTFHLPDQSPLEFGVKGVIPNDLIGQLVYPFKKTG